MLQNILLVVHIIVCVLLIFVVLMQRSEGGALGMGGGPTGFMSARGTGDLLTRSTWILFSIFLVLSIVLTLLAGRDRDSSAIPDAGAVGRIDPNALVRQPAAPASSAPPPVTAPAPQLRTPGLPAAPVDGGLGGAAPAQPAQPAQ